MNDDIKKIIKESRVFHYEIAHELGISEYTLCVWLRKNLSSETKSKILQATKKLKGDNNEQLLENKIEQIENEG
ncbi:MAG: hypothetical protein M0R03_22075 [Novosphingobium sp.]|nr:hypothetical protein [Novosphingobium sp.]